VIKVHRKIRTILMWAFCLYLQLILYTIAWPLIYDFFCYLFGGAYHFCNITSSLCPKCNNFFILVFLYPLYPTFAYGLFLFYWTYLFSFILINKYTGHDKSIILEIALSQLLMVLYFLLLILIFNPSAISFSNVFPFLEFFPNIKLREILEDLMLPIVGNLLFMLFFVPFRHKYLMSSKEQDKDESEGDEEE